LILLAYLVRSDVIHERAFGVAGLQNSIPRSDISVQVLGDLLRLMFGAATLSLVLRRRRGQTNGSVECLDKKISVAEAESSNSGISDDWVARFPQATKPMVFSTVNGAELAGRRALDLHVAAGVVETSRGRVRHCLGGDSKLVSITLMN
jgi:hypothetical protein